MVHAFNYYFSDVKENQSLFWFFEWMTYNFSGEYKLELGKKMFYEVMLALLGALGLECAFWSSGKTDAPG